METVLNTLNLKLRGQSRHHLCEHFPMISPFDSEFYGKINIGLRKLLTSDMR